MRQAGCAINYNIAMAIGKWIVLANDWTLVKENGGSLNLDFSWCQSIFRKIGFTKRRATAAKQPVSPDFLKEMGFFFHRAIKEFIDGYHIPDDLLISNQTPLPFIILSKYSMDKKNLKVVPIANSADYRNLLNYPFWYLLPMQIIYQGVRLTAVTLSSSFQRSSILHIVDHWSNKEKAIELIEKVLLP